MFDDHLLIPPFLALAWSAIMFWGALGWLIYAIFANAQLRANKTIELDLSDFDDIPKEQRVKIEKVCSKRFWAPFKLWFKGLFIIFIIGIMFNTTTN